MANTNRQGQDSSRLAPPPVPRKDTHPLPGSNPSRSRDTTRVIKAPTQASRFQPKVQPSSNTRGHDATSFRSRVNADKARIEPQDLERLDRAIGSARGRGTTSSSLPTASSSRARETTARTNTSRTATTAPLLERRGAIRRPGRGGPATAPTRGGPANEHTRVRPGLVPQPIVPQPLRSWPSLPSDHSDSLEAMARSRRPQYYPEYEAPSKAAMPPTKEESKAGRPANARPRKSSVPSTSGQPPVPPEDTPGKNSLRRTATKFEKGPTASRNTAGEISARRTTNVKPPVALKDRPLHPRSSASGPALTHTNAPAPTPRQVRAQTGWMPSSSSSRPAQADQPAARPSVPTRTRQGRPQPEEAQRPTVAAHKIPTHFGPIAADDPFVNRPDPRKLRGVTMPVSRPPLTNFDQFHGLKPELHHAKTTSGVSRKPPPSPGAVSRSSRRSLSSLTNAVKNISRALSFKPKPKRVVPLLTPRGPLTNVVVMSRDRKYFTREVPSRHKVKDIGKAVLEYLRTPCEQRWDDTEEYTFSRHSPRSMSVRNRGETMPATPEERVLYWSLGEARWRVKKHCTLESDFVHHWEQWVAEQRPEIQAILREEPEENLSVEDFAYPSFWRYQYFERLECHRVMVKMQELAEDYIKRYPDEFPGFKKVRPVIHE
ncbi:Uu.00g140250.m01.CDS01 [Anthostomella pinea]|uniref:Uu.00g140250.m01.CDS01 n=1 Tax=Anthostomella pinea TaxID=933095 RepID=A0AAI8VQV3_9PEZI|nr:Uu.00g140250.m01.CDS01 [Anthostomella pinea]